jgi:hypothetical protein
LADMIEVYMHTEAARKEQPAIRLWHMEERFGGLTLQKKGRARTQHKVLTDYLADMDGLNVCRPQPRPRYAGAEDKFIIESEPINPYTGHRVWKEFPTAQAHAIPRDKSIKLYT